MRGMFRTLALFLALAFAVGTVAHAVQASDMTVEIATAGATGGPMPECDGCGGGDETAKVICLLTCVAPAVAILDLGDATTFATATVVDGAPARHAAGRITLVDPSPPRRHALI